MSDDMSHSEKNTRVSIKILLVNDDNKFLTIRRSKTDPARPLSWDLPGGEVEFGENLEDSIVRETLEETGLHLTDLKIFDASGGLGWVNPNEFWVTLCYTAKPVAGDVVLSYEHDDYKWLTPDEFSGLECSSKKIQRFVKALQGAK